MSHQEPTSISELFFSTCSKILGAFPADHPARLQFNANLESIRPEIEQVLQLFKLESGELLPIHSSLITGTTYNDYYKFTMAPVISCIETLVGQRVTVTFSIDIRDAKLAERLQRNENGIVDDIIRALHQLSERKFNPEIVAAAVEGKPIAGFWAEAATRLLGSADAPLTLIRNFRPQDSSPSDFHARLSSTTGPSCPAT